MRNTITTSPCSEAPGFKSINIFVYLIRDDISFGSMTDKRKQKNYVQTCKHLLLYL